VDLCFHLEVETTEVSQAWEQVGWYEVPMDRGEVSEMPLKTGCHIEERQVQTQRPPATLVIVVTPPWRVSSAVVT